MNHKAIYKLYPQVTSIDDTVGAFDADGNTVVIDMDAVNAWVDPDQYKFDRATAYPTIQEQLDMQYWDGVNGTTIWADTVASVKSENPKP
jgi:hypothetical protein